MSCTCCTTDTPLISLLLLHTMKVHGTTYEGMFWSLHFVTDSVDLVYAACS